MLRQQGNGTTSSSASLQTSSNSRKSSNAGGQSGWRHDDPEDSVREGRTSLAGTPKPQIEAVSRSNGRLLSPSSTADLATIRSHPEREDTAATTTTTQPFKPVSHASSQSLVVDPACNEFAFLDTGSLHSRLNANLAGDVLRTRASLNPETAQLRSRTTSRSNLSSARGHFSDPSSQAEQTGVVETVTGKIASEHTNQFLLPHSRQMRGTTSSDQGRAASAASADAGGGTTAAASAATTAAAGVCGAPSASAAGAAPGSTGHANGSQPQRNDQVAVEISKKTREQRRKEIKKEFEKWDPGEKSGCRWTFVFDPSGRLCYYWSLVVSIAFLYNFWVIIYRFSFSEITTETLPIWFTLDYMADFLYVLDIFFHFRTGYLDEGVLQTDGEKLRNHYLNSTMFYIDALCLLPLDFLYLSIHFNSILRGFRLVKIYRFWAFLDRTERHTNYPNVFRAINLTHYVLVIFHWNACISHIIDKNDVFGSGERWFNNSMCGNDTVCEYLHAFYWSTLSFTTVGDLPRPRTKGQYLFLIIQLVLGLFLFATVLGHVANIVTNVSAARKEFQAKLDAVKTYMRMRHVPDHLQNKVIRWFDYLWMTQKSSDEERSVGCLPDKLKAEIAIHVHLDTLKRVEIFQNTEAGFLCELVLRLRPVLFSPGDYICRKGEVGKEMYIVNRGKLQVVADDGKTVLATLRAGSYFGEISILNMGTAGNRRTASVRSVGYSDLFCLYKHDMWDVLKDYPAARVRLEAIAVKRLEKYKKEPIKKMAMGRSRSTPGLLESRGKKTLEDTPVQDNGVARPRPMKASSTCSSPRGQREGHVRTSSYLSEQRSTCCHSSLRTSPAQTTGRHASSATAAGPQRAYPHSSSIVGRSPHPSATSSLHAQQHYQPPPSPLPQFLNLPPGSPQHAGTTFTLQGPHAFIPIPTGTPVLASRSSPYTDYTNVSPVSSSNEPTTVAPPTALYGTSPGNSSTAIGTGQTHLFVPSPLQTSGIHSGAHSPTVLGSATRDQEDLLNEIKRLRERLVTLETENATMSIKLSQSTWQVENRLAEIEMHISTKNQHQYSPQQPRTECPTDSEFASGSDSDERNRESII